MNRIETLASLREICCELDFILRDERGLKNPVTKSYLEVIKGLLKIALLMEEDK